MCALQTRNSNKSSSLLAPPSQATTKRFISTKKTSSPPSENEPQHHKSSPSPQQPVPRRSIRQLSCEVLKVIASLKHENDTLIKASSSLMDIVSGRSCRGSTDVKAAMTDRKRAEEPVNERYKTELCRKFMENSSCPYGRKCQFSHGYHELRPVIKHPRYRTELCREFFNTGLCTYGTRCNFIHHELSHSPLPSPLHQSHHHDDNTEDHHHDVNTEDHHDDNTEDYFTSSTAMRESFGQQTAASDTSERPFTPNNDSGFCLGSLNPSFSSTPSSLAAYSPIGAPSNDERTDSPNDLYAIPEEVVRGAP